MKTPVTNQAVEEYARRIIVGESTKDVFPARMSDCDFTQEQRMAIRLARTHSKALQKKATNTSAPIAATVAPTKAPPPPQNLTPLPPKPTPPPQKPSTTQQKATPPRTKSDVPKGQSRLEKLLFLQSGRCFFCRQPLALADANIEHLNPKSRGGKGNSDNVVACHKTLNDTFGDMDLKSKIDFVLRSAGNFKCPKL